jgi:hypothetical protein
MVIRSVRDVGDAYCEWMHEHKRSAESIRDTVRAFHTLISYPQIHGTVLSETGTHVLVEAFVKRGKKSEFPLAGSWLRKVPKGSWVLGDRRFYG